MMQVSSSYKVHADNRAMRIKWNIPETYTASRSNISIDNDALAINSHRGWGARNIAFASEGTSWEGYRF